MSDDNLKQLFEHLKNDFDIEEPLGQHKNRFLAKLTDVDSVANKKPSRIFWKPFMAIAASIVLLVAIFIGNQTTGTDGDLASVSSEMSETQDFFTTTIAEEMRKIEIATTPEFHNVVQDAMLQIKNLENNYESLKQDLSESGNDQRVIYAMISNFQNRIEILQNVLEHIERIKQLKNTNHENSTTI